MIIAKAVKPYDEPLEVEHELSDERLEMWEWRTRAGTYIVGSVYEVPTGELRAMILTLRTSRKAARYGGLIMLLASVGLGSLVVNIISLLLN